LAQASGRAAAAFAPAALVRKRAKTLIIRVFGAAAALRPAGEPARRGPGGSLAGVNADMEPK